jgi:hypothetical protein
MTKRTTKKATLTADPDGTPSAETIRQALDELAINRPYYSCRVVGNRLELALYGGDVVFWPPKPEPKRKG